MSQPNYAGRRVNARAIIYKDGQLLAVKHFDDDGGPVPYYAIPGGGVDPSESLEQGLRREVMEELGVKAVIGRLLFIQQFHTRREGFDEELEFFFAIDNPEDFEELDIASTSHGSGELAVCEFVDPKKVEIFPRFLSSIEMDDYCSNIKPVLIVDNFNEKS